MTLFFKKGNNTISMGKTKKNIIYQMGYQILAVILPLITTPIVTRGLGADALGQYSYTYAIVSYFSVFAMLGVNSYGTREIAKARSSGNQSAVDVAFSEIYSLQIVLSLIAIGLYFFFVIFTGSRYKLIALIQGIYLFGTLTDVAWFYFGIEDFKTTVTRNIIVKLVSASVIIAFVRSPSDLLLYTITLIGSTTVSNIILVFKLQKYISFHIPTIKRVLYHLKPNLILFVPVVAASFYVYIDKIMLGSISGTVQSGYYDVMEKIINVPNACVAAITNVMFPRIASLVSENSRNNGKQISQYITASICGVVFFTVGCFLGLKAVAFLFVPLFLGDEFSKAVDIIILGAAILIPRGVRGVIKSECLLPYEKDKEVIISIVSGAVCDFIVNLALIPKYGAVGAVVATLVCESVSCLMMLFYARKQFDTLKHTLISLPFILFAVVMYSVITLLIKILAKDGWMGLGVYVVAGGLIYCTLSAGYMLLIKKKGII